MRIGVIRGDLPGPIFVGDLEPTSQTNYTTEPVGQTRYVSYPNPTNVTNALAAIPATLASTGNITFPLTLSGSNDVLHLRALATGLYTTVTVANGAYANITTLLAALNTALVASGLPIVASPSLAAPTLQIAFAVTTPTGIGASIGLDSVGNGSLGNASFGFATTAASFTVPTAAAIITALLPVGGPLHVSQAAVLTEVGGGLSAAQVAIVANSVAPQFIESNVAIQSFVAGNLAKLLSANFNPDVNRVPAITPGAAITVVQDDGTTVFTGGFPIIVTAHINVPNAGDVTITGTNIGNSEQEQVKVKFTGIVSQIIVQKTLERTLTGGTQGAVSSTSIVIPASLIPGAAAATSSVQVKFGSFASNIVALS